MSRIRIVGGEWKRRLITFSDAPGLRPTPDAVRETLFNWLGQDLAGLACLDLFAGSGVLGFEAASRGARHVTMVERDARTFATLENNAIALEAGAQTGRLELIRADALKFLSRASRRYDLLFLDPPYRQGWIERVEPCLPAVLAADARIYAEAEHRIERIGAWETVRDGRAGQVYYHLLEANTDE
ncbi:MAG: 16S rRNA (guanine(966)-N(2))-methyltransferase RsmD [Sulfuritalea sp.]|nr:16S rRNA (guanine(966)-N(2))-methyltransferase RsmD [Sulfuritalea sp.]